MSYVTCVVLTFKVVVIFLSHSLFSGTFKKELTMELHIAPVEHITIDIEVSNTRIFFYKKPSYKKVRLRKSEN